MLKKIQSLYFNLNKRGLSQEANLIYLLIKYAGYEDEWQERIEDLAAQNPMPFDDWFNGKSRAYYPFNPGEDVDAPIDPEVEDELEENGFEVTDYIEGYCQKNGRKFKIGKVLNKLKKQKRREVEKKLEEDNYDEEMKKRILENLEEAWKELINTFVNSKYRRNKQYQDNLMVVFSQNPHDIAKMSYDRDWTSCMELGRGSQYESVLCEVQKGGLIAYLTTADDTEIENPLARIHIRRFVSNTGLNIAKPESAVYGNSVPGFEEFVHAWVNNNNQERFRENNQQMEGVYNLVGGEYSDTFSESFIKTPRTKEGLVEWLKKPIPDTVKTTWTVCDEFFEELQDINYWGQDIEYIFGPDYDGCKEFSTKKEAESFLNQIKQYDYFDDWVNYIIDAGEQEYYEEQGVLDEKIEELKEERFELSRFDYDQEENLRAAAVEKLANYYLYEIDSELAESLIEYIEKNQSYKNNRELIKLYQAFPELLSEQRFKKLRIANQKNILDYLDTNNPEEKDRLFQFFKERIKNSININSDFFEKGMISIIRDNRSGIGRGFYSDLMMTLREVINAAISSKNNELSEDILNFVFKDFKNISNIYTIDDSVVQKLQSSLIFSAIRSFTYTNSEKAIESLEKIWNTHRIGSFGADDNETLAWIKEVGFIGEKGKIFYPHFIKIIETTEENVKKELQELFQHPPLPSKQFEDWMKTTINRRLRILKGVAKQIGIEEEIERAIKENDLLKYMQE